MNKFQITNGDGWKVHLSTERLFIVNAQDGARVADFRVDEKLLDALTKALETRDGRTTVENKQESASSSSESQKKKKKKSSE